jgi:hypothetical protein
LPAELDKQVLDSGALREANFARRQLLHRLDAGARLRQPLLAAIAQVNFDCWVAPVPKAGGSPKGDECRRRFYFAFAGLAPGGSDLPPEAIPTEDTGSPGPIIAASASDLAPPQPPATRQLIVTPATNASSTSSAGRSKGVGLASASGPETLYSPTDRRSLARLIQRLMNQTECDRKVGKCVPLGFTGPSADLLIRDLRDSGPDGNGASGGDSVAGSAVGGGDEGNGRNKGSVHGNGHGKGPG